MSYPTYAGVKLHFDQNLSPRLVIRLVDLFEDSSHTDLPGLARANDEDVWAYARDNGFTLVTKDADFADIATVRGSPPKVLWLRTGNYRTVEVERLC